MFWFQASTRQKAEIEKVLAQLKIPMKAKQRRTASETGPRAIMDQDPSAETQEVVVDDVADMIDALSVIFANNLLVCSYTIVGMSL